MKDGLSSISAVIDDHAVSFPVKTVLSGNGLSNEEKMSDHLPVRILHTMNIDDMLLWYDKDMRRRLRIHIFEGKSEIILMHDRRWYLPVKDLAEYAVLSLIHGVDVSLEKMDRKKQLLSPV